ncbi:Protein of unknown function [Variovorax sp. OK605]|uniref:DUF2971 domain-containing protein n=1 Tax=Variovorax sp. OK605 TaxID=1855317 RepID=UPI0008ED5831|nr:DUF2971 domain-containing protein [Variovorax sp. OK605]SFP33500.1 Protein of unknown function [Variovorax sp. OK605]
MTDTTAPAKPQTMTVPPASLFKYFGPGGTRFFANWLVRFSQPAALNDPFEFSPHVRSWGTPDEEAVQAGEVWERRMEDAYGLQKPEFQRSVPFDAFLVARRRFKAAEVLEELARVRSTAYPEMAAGITEMANAGVGALCLTENADNLLMWSHYSESHTGFLIELDTSDPFFTAIAPPAHVKADAAEFADFAAEYGRLRQVIYADERPEIVLTEMSFDVFLTKGTCWTYEQEWRMFMPLSYSPATHHGPLVVPHPVWLWPLPKSAIRRVVAGARATPAVINTLKRLKTDPSTEHIVVEQAQVDPKHFRLNFGVPPN